MWVNALRNQADPNTPQEILKEAELLRGIYCRHVETAYRKPSEFQVRSFLTRLHREGVLTAKRKFGLFTLVAGLSFAAFGLALSVQVWKYQQVDEIEDAVMRGSEQAQRVETANPKGLSGRIETILNAYGIEARRVDGAKAVRLQAKVPLDASPVRNELAGIGISVPEHGRLDIFLVRP